MTATDSLDHIVYVSPASPFARKVRVMVRECALTERIRLENVNTNALATDPTLMSVNPLGKLPALLRPDGKLICDSRVICRYLDDLGGAGLYPASRIWDVLTLEALCDGILEACVLMTYERRLRPEEKVFEEWIEAQWSKASRTLDVIDSQWMDALDGPLTAAHISVGCALGYVDLRHDARDWRATRPRLATWADGFLNRPAMNATAPA